MIDWLSAVIISNSTIHEDHDRSNNNGDELFGGFSPVRNPRLFSLESLSGLDDSLAFLRYSSLQVRRQIKELEMISGLITNSLVVDVVPVVSYLSTMSRVVWDEAKWPAMFPLKEIIDEIHV
ncbi:hypothetical protein C3L33_14490, partial [Rhododendron williamsianum]